MRSNNGAALNQETAPVNFTKVQIFACSIKSVYIVQLIAASYL